VAVAVLMAALMELLVMLVVLVVVVEQAVVAVALLVVQPRHPVKVMLAALVVLALYHHFAVAVEVELVRLEQLHLHQVMAALEQHHQLLALQ